MWEKFHDTLPIFLHPAEQYTVYRRYMKVAWFAHLFRHFIVIQAGFLLFPGYNPLSEWVTL